MDSNQLNPLFKNSSFLLIKKEEYDSDEYQEILSKLNFQANVQKFHIDRKKEYELVRIAIHLLLKKEFNMNITNFESSEDRSPVWPKGIIGSITHSKDYVLIALSNKSQCLGIDLENLGRMKKDIGRHILHEKDILSFSGLDEEKLLTLIFCAKEALYKALYPKVNKFFGFDSAYISKIDLINFQFEINLAKDLSNEINMASTPTFQGRFFLNDSHCLAIIEF